VPFRILIADDHFELREMLKALLETNPGWQVCAVATNGREAVEQAAQTHPDLVILDLSMPEMDGLQAASLISSTSPQVPILLYTNHALPTEVEQEIKKYGVWEVLNKGGSPKRLLSAVEALHNGQMKTAAKPTGTELDPAIVEAATTDAGPSDPEGSSDA
jgi:DNA-binding NarL/FixJ family response regulator